MRSLLMMAWALTCMFSVVVQAEPRAANNDGIDFPNPGADLWRAVRQRNSVEPGKTQVQGLDTGVLVDVRGDQFREFRRKRFLPYAGWLLAGIATLIALFHILHGAVTFEPRGRRIQRFDLYDRIAHWTLASIFLFLGVTGLTLAFGRFLLLPWIGQEAYSVLASAAKEGHNLFGPLFLVALMWVIVRYLSRNWPSRQDLFWLLKGGGFFGKSHVSAGFFNAGEKLWFWLLAFGGLALSLSGLVLDFPRFSPGRDLLILALVVHGIAAMLLLAFALGHIYVGTVGVKGTLDGMITGEVDEGWARSHHDKWVENLGEKPPSVISEHGQVVDSRQPNGEAVT